ncbi:MAG: AAA family ATPase [Acidithiobacillus sp.]
MTTSRNPGNAGIPMVPLIDWADFADPPPPVDWLVEGILPAGVAGDVFGPPNAGKSSLIYSLAVHIAEGSPTWFGRTIKSGRVVVVVGEHSGRDAHWRSAHRFVAEVHLPRGQLFTVDQTPILKWHKGYTSDKTQEGWYYRQPVMGKDERMNHPGGAAIIEKIAELRPALVIFDTTLAVAEGCNQLDNPQQYALSEFMQKRIVPDLHGSTVITISHTNQASSGKELSGRLHYESRAGGNGAPGAFRWMAGLTRIRNEEDCEALGDVIDARDVKRRSFFAFGVSKHNEIGPAWTNESPAVFEIMADGKILMVASGEQVKEAQEAAARNKEDRKEDGSKKAKGKASTENGSGYDYYAFKNGGDGNPAWNFGGDF